LVGRPLGKYNFKKKDTKPTVYFLKTAQLILCQVAGQMNGVARVTPNACKEINKDKKGNIVPLHATNVYKEKEGIAPIILNLGTRHRCVVNFTPQLLCSPERTQVPSEKEAELAPESV